MIDMQAIFTHPEYETTVNKFKSSNCKWSIFQNLHKAISNNKCPICEVELSATENHAYSATIDHFRPKAQNMYPYLKCEPKNYILMCSLCNNRYKQAKFPLVDESKRAIDAKTIEETQNEQPLLFNPAEEKPLYFFELVFRKTVIGSVLEMEINKIFPTDSYDYQRCEAMIKLFGLGYVDTHPHPNEKTKNLRIDVLTAHYEIFIELAKAINEQDKKSFALILSNKNRKEMLEKYGFFQFLINKQFSIY